MKSPANVQKRVLGIDLGLKRTGLAVSDEFGVTVRRLEVFKPQNRAQDVAKILGICEALGVSDIVIGYPFSDIAETAIAHRARQLSLLLPDMAKERGLEVKTHLLDESLTSKEANRRLLEMGTSRGSRKDKLDAEAACLLVEDFLTSRSTQ